jgi:ornithine cyclodeaminase/alanine dehydrogenase-like protein (mu-crystallin family)
MGLIIGNISNSQYKSFTNSKIQDFKNNINQLKICNIIITDNIYSLLSKYKPSDEQLIISIGEIYIHSEINIVSLIEDNHHFYTRSVYPKIRNDLSNLYNYLNLNTNDLFISEIDLVNTHLIKHDIFSKNLISFLNIISLVKNNFINKSYHQLPPKISLHTEGDGFYNTMPCIKNQVYSCKIIIRNLLSENNHTTPLLKGHIHLYDIPTSHLLSIIDAKWITSIRTGAVAALSIQTLANINFKTISFVGLGNCGIACMHCLLELYPIRNWTIKLLKYKTSHLYFKQRFSDYLGLTFVFCNTFEELISSTDILVSSVSAQSELFVKDTKLYPPGILVVPIQTRGFQNCDIDFDRVIVDDIPHIKHFGNFSKMKYIAELGEVLNSTKIGRNSQEERIIAYNIGLALHDNSIALACYFKSIMNQKTYPFLLSDNAGKIVI